MKKENTAKYIIVGAGLSGLTSAYLLDKQNETDFLILESRDRIGGRILTKNNIDLGATWFQTHHKNVFNLIDSLGIGQFSQYNKGKSVLVYNTMAPPHYFESDQNAPSGFRIQGGTSAIINNLSKGIQDKIKLKTTIHEIQETEKGITIVTNSGNYYAEKIIVTIPPRIASKNILYSPKLPSKLLSVMKNTHTWMSNAIKVGLTFETPFWRKKDFSGTIIGQIGPVTELYDHNSNDGNKFALMGFVNEGLRDLLPKDRKESILNFLKNHLGDEIFDYTTYEEKDWSEDKNTACEHIHSVYLAPKYGDPIFSDLYLNGKLLFSGAETSPIHGGYMDGAIYSGINAVKKMLEN